VTRLAGLAVEVVQTLLRMLPFPCRTGLIRIGHPDRGAPVLLTGNFRLTVERVKRSLRGLDAYLLVANSRGVNVWCAATGGLLTNHDVVSVLKTSGVEELVDHRRVILPQLAGTGVEGPVVRQKTGWRVVWGPVEASAIPGFLGAGLEATRGMREVHFPWPRRLEMAVAWAFPISLVGALALAPFWSEVVPGLVALVWGLSLAIFLAFPLYQRWLHPAGERIGFVFFDFGRAGLPLLAWLAFLAASLLLGIELRWSLAALVVLAILCLDLMGSTPTYKSGLHEDRRLRITLDEARCRGAGFCETVCPVDVFEVDVERRLASLPRASRCVQCGACIVQCPFDALWLEGPAGEVLSPETVRRFKLNLRGQRMRPASPGPTRRA
jgi:ferredoxin